MTELASIPEQPPNGQRWLEHDPAVEVVGITKRYGQVAACDSVNLVLRRGQIHGVLGENGAGKSTLMKVLIGLVVPDSGQVIIDGKPSVITDPIDAAAKGIGMVHQHFSVVNALTVWENVALGDQLRLNPQAVRDEIGDLSRHYGLAIEPNAIVGTLTAGLRQRVEIIKCLRRSPRTVILDEPTSVLTPGESEVLFEGLRRAVEDEGMAIALVSHKLDEILGATDLVTIMRRGQVVAHQKTSDSDAAGLARAMVGRPVALRSERNAATVDEAKATASGGTTQAASTQPASSQAGRRPKKPEQQHASLEIDSVYAKGDDGRVLLDGLDLKVYRGEIVGLAGVEGNGQRPLGDLLSSLLSISRGSVRVDGKSIACGRAGAMAKAGISVIPEDRHDSGCVLEMSVAENLFLADPNLVARRGILDQRKMTYRAERLIERFAISCEGPDAPMWSLSGGNQQRVVLAREMAHHPRVLVAAQPTRGLDVGAIEYMSEQLRQAAAAGVAVLLISTELDEILDLASRLVVLSKGRIVGEMSREAVDIERLGLMMGGAVS